ncbi:MAG TPA: (2Fe-2S)-binding protein [Crenalkalicoccus sp.]|jgi:bacterioferritin-associated ferredoxin|nr:(2Fe-2S)-binding protein [Crenalkalicoccus sp.]
MYVCLCNSLTDAQVKRVVQEGACRPRDVYGVCGCRAQCGGCTRTILGMIRDHVSAPCAPMDQ